MEHNSIPSIVTKITEIRNAGITSHGEKDNSQHTFGGFISDGESAWLCNGSLLKIINVVNGCLISSYDFSLVSKNGSTKISSVIEFPLHDKNVDEPCLIVGYNVDNIKAFLSFYHPQTSRILHTICLKGQITSLNMITSKRSHSSPLSSIIKMMAGVLAVGMAEGIVCIIDMKTYDLLMGFYDCHMVKRKTNYPENGRLIFVDVENDSKEEIRSKLSYSKTCKAHLAFILNADYLIDETRILIGSEDFYRKSVHVSTMLFIPTTTILAIGFNIGSFQLWDMNQLVCLYTAPCVKNATPITRFSFQKPCNDPQQCCYLWVMYESNRPTYICLPFATMYCILFKRRSESCTSSGDHYYKDFVTIRRRFRLDLDHEEGFDGRCVTSHVVSNTTSYLLGGSYDNDDKNTAKINLFVMIFETWEKANDSGYISILVFDMNQWYKEQMPDQYFPGFSQPFINSIAVDKIAEYKFGLYDVHIKKETIQQFLAFNSSEQYCHPASLSFDSLFLMENKIIHLHLPGIQRHILDSINKKGPVALVHPNKYYMMCRSAGLTPVFFSDYTDAASWSEVKVRNFVLTVLLEHKMAKFLMQCACEWSDGRYVISQCTLNSLISWCWNCVSRIKNLCDAICIPLFDYTGTELDRENYYKLKHCSQLIHIITDLLTFIHVRYRHSLLDGGAKLISQLNALALIKQYFDVIIWCIDSQLLPEKLESTSETSIPAYLMSLMQGSQQRRVELNKAASSVDIPESSNLYLIDEIIKEEPNGEKICQQWERESGCLSDGSYPPITLQSLLRIYLISNVSMEVKHSIMLYFLLDVCNYHKDEEMGKKLLSFPFVIGRNSVKTSIVKLYWFVDNKRFEDVAGIISEEKIKKSDINPKFHRKIVHAMLIEDHAALAFKYLHLVRPICTDINDDIVYIMVLLLNGLIIEAFNVQRNNISHQDDLLAAFFKNCERFGILKKVLKLSLTEKEERSFISYLDKCSDKQTSEDLKILYFLSRGRYVEAIDFNQQLNSTHSSLQVGRNTGQVAGKSTTRDLLVKAFSKTLPSITNDLINYCSKRKPVSSFRKVVAKPTPLSVVVHTDMSKEIPTYKSTSENMFQAAFSKTREIWVDLPKTPCGEKCISKMQTVPFLRSGINTPLKHGTESALSNNTQLINSRKRSADSIEHPNKRFKKQIQQMGNKTKEDDVVNKPDVTPPLLEVDNFILRTPHVQKRITPFSSSANEATTTPKSSILKRNSLPRFKLPPKVDFDIPEATKSPISSKVQLRPPTPKPLNRIDKEMEVAYETTPVKISDQSTPIKLSVGNQKQETTPTKIVCIASVEPQDTIDEEMEVAYETTPVKISDKSAPIKLPVGNQKEETTPTKVLCIASVEPQDKTAPVTPTNNIWPNKSMITGNSSDSGSAENEKLNTSADVKKLETITSTPDSNKICPSSTVIKIPISLLNPVQYTSQLGSKSTSSAERKIYTQDSPQNQEDIDSYLPESESEIEESSVCEENDDLQNSRYSNVSSDEESTNMVDENSSDSSDQPIPLLDANTFKRKNSEYTQATKSADANLTAITTKPPQSLLNTLFDRRQVNRQKSISMVPHKISNVAHNETIDLCDSDDSESEDPKSFPENKLADKMGSMSKEDSCDEDIQAFSSGSSYEEKTDTKDSDNRDRHRKITEDEKVNILEYYSNDELEDEEENKEDVDDQVDLKEENEVDVDDQVDLEEENEHDDDIVDLEEEEEEEEEEDDDLVNLGEENEDDDEVDLEEEENEVDIDDLVDLEEEEYEDDDDDDQVDSEEESYDDQSEEEEYKKSSKDRNVLNVCDSGSELDLVDLTDDVEDTQPLQQELGTNTVARENDRITFTKNITRQRLEIQVTNASMRTDKSNSEIALSDSNDDNSVSNEESEINKEDSEEVVSNNDQEEYNLYGSERQNKDEDEVLSKRTGDNKDLKAQDNLNIDHTDDSQTLKNVNLSLQRKILQREEDSKIDDSTENSVSTGNCSTDEKMLNTDEESHKEQTLIKREELLMVVSEIPLPKGDASNIKAALQTFFGNSEEPIPSIHNREELMVNVSEMPLPNSNSSIHNQEDLTVNVSEIPLPNSNSSIHNEEELTVNVSEIPLPNSNSSNIETKRQICLDHNVSTPEPVALLQISKSSNIETPPQMFFGNDVSTPDPIVQYDSSMFLFASDLLDQKSQPFDSSSDDKLVSEGTSGDAKPVDEQTESAVEQSNKTSCVVEKDIVEPVPKECSEITAVFNVDGTNRSMRNESWSLNISDNEPIEIVDSSDDERWSYRTKKRKISQDSRILNNPVDVSKPEQVVKTDSNLILNEDKHPKEVVHNKNENNETTTLTECAENIDIDASMMEEDKTGVISCSDQSFTGPSCSRLTDESDWSLNIPSSEITKITGSTDDEEDSFYHRRKKRKRVEKGHVSRIISSKPDDATDSEFKRRTSSSSESDGTCKIITSDEELVTVSNTEGDNIITERNVKRRSGSRYSSKSSLADIKEEPEVDVACNLTNIKNIPSDVENIPSYPFNAKKSKSLCNWPITEQRDSKYWLRSQHSPLSVRSRKVSKLDQYKSNEVTENNDAEVNSPFHIASSSGRSQSLLNFPLTRGHSSPTISKYKLRSRDYLSQPSTYLFAPLGEIPELPEDGTVCKPSDSETESKKRYKLSVINSSNLKSTNATSNVLDYNQLTPKHVTRLSGSSERLSSLRSSASHTSSIQSRPNRTSLKGSKDQAIDNSPNSDVSIGSLSTPQNLSTKRIRSERMKNEELSESGSQSTPLRRSTRHSAVSSIESDQTELSAKRNLRFKSKGDDDLPENTSQATPLRRSTRHSVSSIESDQMKLSAKRSLIRNITGEEGMSENTSRSSLRRPRKLSVTDSVESEDANTRKGALTSGENPTVPMTNPRKSIPTTSTPSRKLKSELSSSDYVNEYVNYRRLTRNQLNLMEGKLKKMDAQKSPGNSNLTTNDDSKNPAVTPKSARHKKGTDDSVKPVEAPQSGRTRKKKE